MVFTSKLIRLISLRINEAKTNLAFKFMLILIRNLGNKKKELHTCLFSLYLYLAHNSWKSHGGVSSSHWRTTAAKDQMSENNVGLSPKKKKKYYLDCGF